MNGIGMYKKGKQLWSPVVERLALFSIQQTALSIF